MALPPVPLRIPILDNRGQVAPAWAAYFRELSKQVGETVSSADLEAHLEASSDAHDASAISVVPAGNLASSNVQSALVELQGDTDSLALGVADAQADASAAQEAIDDHLSDSDDAHDASAISYDNGTSGLSATNVQEAVDELASDLSGVRTGTIQPWLFSFVPSGWLALNGQTIGSASSGADRANADTEALFTLFWEDYDNTALPILDSSGNPTTRGASAAADFAANKRLPIFNAEGLVARGTGTQAINGRDKVGPAVGEKQEDQMQRITGMFEATRGRGGYASAGAFSPTATGFVSCDGTGNFGVQYTLNSANSPGARASAATDGETRASSFGVRWIIKL